MSISPYLVDKRTFRAYALGRGRWDEWEAVFPNGAAPPVSVGALRELTRTIDIADNDAVASIWAFIESAEGHVELRNDVPYYDDEYDDGTRWGGPSRLVFVYNLYADRDLVSDPLRDRYEDALARARVALQKPQSAGDTE